MDIAAAAAAACSRSVSVSSITADGGPIAITAPSALGTGGAVSMVSSGPGSVGPVSELSPGLDDLVLPVGGLRLDGLVYLVVGLVGLDTLAWSRLLGFAWRWLVRRCYNHVVLLVVNWHLMHRRLVVLLLVLSA